MFNKKNKKRLCRVEILFMHGGDHGAVSIPPFVIDLSPGEEYVRDIVQDEVWDGKTLVRSYDWLAGYTRVYRFFYQ